MDTPNEPVMDRKERRSLLRQEQRQGQSSQQRSRLFRRILLWGGGILLLVGFGWGMVRLADHVQLPTQGGVLAVPVGATDHTFGPAGAPITLVEYADYQCPACGSFYPIIKQLFAEPDLKDKVRLVYRNFPLTQLHANAQIAAQAAEAAALQGKFWEMHDKIFEGQQKWSGMSDAGARGQFATYAQELKLDAAQFARDIDSSTVKDRIKSDYDGGVAAVVDATPTFFVNGTKMPPPQSYEQFKQYVQNSIQPNP